MAKRLIYLQNHDGEREWVLDAFTDEDFTKNQYIYLCQHSDGNKTELEIIKIPRSQWSDLVANVEKVLGKFE